MENLAERFRIVSELLRGDNPIEGIKELDKIADDIKNYAQRLRENIEKNRSPFLTRSGMSDQVKICLIGPDGKQK
jgi:hypothetical protein